jgi:WD40 repeat protein
MSEQTYMASAIRHLAQSAGGDIIAAALFEHTVSLWDISTADRIAEFETILDFGGTRLALSQSEGACLTAAYHIHGLACYSTPAGNLRWQRKDLKKIQQIAVTSDGYRVYCCLEEGSCQIVDISTGVTIDRIRGLRRVYVDSHDAFRLHESSKLSVVDRNGKQRFRIEPDSFAVLDAAFSETFLLISESGADVRMFDLSSGKEVIRHRQPKNHHVLELSFAAGDTVFYGVQWNYNNGGPKCLLRFSPDTPEFDVIRDIGEPAEVVFCHGGRHLLTSEGNVIECKSGKTVMTLPFPQKEYPKD